MASTPVRSWANREETVCYTCLSRGYSTRPVRTSALPWPPKVTLKCSFMAWLVVGFIHSCSYFPLSFWLSVATPQPQNTQFSISSRDTNKSIHDWSTLPLGFPYFSSSSFVLSIKQSILLCIHNTPWRFTLKCGYFFPALITLSVLTLETSFILLPVFLLQRGLIVSRKFFWSGWTFWPPWNFK